MAGFRLSSSLSYDVTDLDKDLIHERADVNLELTRLAALAKPAYMVAEAKVDGIDPVERAFNHLQTCRERAYTLIAFRYNT